MKIATWNVNGIRAIIKKGFIESLAEIDADIVCCQEVKASEEQFIDEIWEIKWYKYHWNHAIKPWYAGTCIFYRDSFKLIGIQSKFDDELFDSDWRLITIEFESDSKKIVLFNVYFPNGWTRADWREMLTYKLAFYDKIIALANGLVKEWKTVIITWDFNICHEEIDIARPEANKNSIWFLPIERAKVTEFINNWYIDTLRYEYPDKIIYSWWSYRAGARPRNVGWRLDYYLVSENLIKNVVSTDYLTKIMWSDHCPVTLTIK